MNTDQLIDKLVAEGAQKPLPHPMKQALFWLLGTLVYLAAFSFYMGFRADIAAKFAEPLYIAELVLMSLTAISAGWAALCLSRPDCCQMPWIKYVPFDFLVLWAAVAFLGAENLNGTTILHTATLCQFDCPWHIFLFSLGPGIALFFLVRKGAPVQPYWAGTMATLSVTAFGYLCMRLVEMNDNPAHLLVWHALPVMIMSIAGMLAGKYTLRWL
jgi:hypothetical protein